MGSCIAHSIALCIVAPQKRAQPMACPVFRAKLVDSPDQRIQWPFWPDLGPQIMICTGPWVPSCHVPCQGSQGREANAWLHLLLNIVCSPDLRVSLTRESRQPAWPILQPHFHREPNWQSYPNFLSQCHPHAALLSELK